jgi:ferredoxin
MKSAWFISSVILAAVFAACLSTSGPSGPPPEFTGYLQVDTGYTDKGDYWWPGHLSTFGLHWEQSSDAHRYEVRISPVHIDADNWNRALLAASVPGGTDSCLVALSTEVYTNTCISCGLCVEACPQDAMSLGSSGAVIDTEKCTACGQCLLVCPVDAVTDSRFNQAYYIAVRAFSETGVPSVEVACSQVRYRMIYRNEESRCGKCNNGVTSTCYAVREDQGPGCPVDAIYWDEEFLIYIDYDLCIYCGQCFIQCRAHPTGSIGKYVLEM